MQLDDVGGGGGYSAIVLGWPRRRIRQDHEDIECCCYSLPKPNRSVKTTEVVVKVPNNEVPKTKRRSWKFFLRGRNLLKKKQQQPIKFPLCEQIMQQQQQQQRDGQEQVDKQLLDERQAAPLIEHLIHIDCRDGEDEEETSYYFDEYYHQVRTSSIEMILPRVLFRGAQDDDDDNDDSWQSLFPCYTQQEDDNDDVLKKKKHSKDLDGSEHTVSTVASDSSSFRSVQKAESTSHPSSKGQTAEDPLLVERNDDDDDDPWTAARRGDLEALWRWTHHDWTREDDFGNTPLYYACHSGAARNLRVVSFLLEQWPNPTDSSIPLPILDRCKKNAINPYVVRLLEQPENADTILLEASQQNNDHGSESSSVGGGFGMFGEEDDGDY